MVQNNHEMMDPLHTSDATSGWCRRCETEHTLPQAPARAAMKSLQAQLEAGRLTSTVGAKDERGREIGSTNKLFEPYGGKMFGVLVGECAEGQRVVLRAFSGQLDGAWDVPGWCPPLFDVPRWRALEATYEPEIKEVTAALATASRPEERVRLQHLHP